MAFYISREKIPSLSTPVRPLKLLAVAALILFVIGGFGSAWSAGSGSLLSPESGTPQAVQSLPAHRGPHPSKSPWKAIDINEADESEFEKLPGIGPKLARQIIAYRRKHGPFRRVEDLMAVKGIGLKKWKTVRPYIRVGHDGKEEGGN